MGSFFNFLFPVCNSFDDGADYEFCCKRCVKETFNGNREHLEKYLEHRKMSEHLGSPLF